MKNNREKKLLHQTFLNFSIKIILWTFLLPLFFYFAALIISHLDFQWLYDWSPNLYYDFISLFQRVFDGVNILILIFVIWFTGALLLLYRLLNKVFSYITFLDRASSQLLDRNVEYIELPSELVEIQKKLNHLKRESEKNERLARENEQRKDDLIVYLAHDIKTPLTSMIGYLSLLDEVSDMPVEQRKRYISIALEKSYRLEELINELFDITRFNSEKIILEKEKLNLFTMLEQIVDDFYPILKETNKKIVIEKEDMDSIVFLADPDKLARVFNNIIKNAIYYSYDESEIVIHIEKKQEQVLISISNFGKTIPEDRLQKIFEKFYRLDSSRTTKTGGSGLGLAIAKEIVELHGGNITATSKDGITTFSVFLPII